MGLSVLLDTNAILYFLKGVTPTPDLPGDRFYVSIVTEIELLSFPRIDEDHEKEILEFLSKVEIVSLSQSVKVKTIEVRRAASLRLPDAIIAATALILDAEVLSNDSDLDRVSGLRRRPVPLKS